MLRRRLRPAGLTARGRAARRPRRAAGGSRALALCSLVREPPAPPPLAAAGRWGSPCGLLAPTRLRRLEAPVSLTPPSPPRLSSSRSGASLSPVRPLLALGSFCRRWGLAAPHSGAPGPCARQLGAGGLALSRAALSGAASGPSTAPGWLGWRGSRTGSSVRRAGERVCSGLTASGKASRPRPLPSPFLPLPSPTPSRRRRRLLPASPPAPPSPLLCWFHCAVARPAPASSRGRLDTLSL